MATTSTKKIYKFGTSGYRHDQDPEFNDAVVRQITQAISDFLIEQIQKREKNMPILIGGDTREKSRRYIPIIAEQLRENGLDVFQASGDVPSPVLAYAAKYFSQIDPGFDETLGAVLMTASHNPWPYGGYNFLTPDAAVMPTPMSKRLEELQEQPLNLKLNREAVKAQDMAQIRYFDPYLIYKRHLKENIGINYDAIRESGLAIYYDPLYATGRRYFPRLLKEEGIEITSIHDTDERPAGYAGMPEPTGSVLTELSALVRQDKTHALKAGFSNDGDADRFGVLDDNGQYINSNEVLALTLYHLLKNRKEAGVVVRSQATTHLLDALAEQANLQVIQTPVGYKYIAEEFIEHEEPGKIPVLLGGESSGGISIKGHIPEKDGLLANLLIAELIGVEKQPLTQILQQVRDSVSRKFVFRELGVKTESGKDIMAYFQNLADHGGEFGEALVNADKSRHSAEQLQAHYGTRDGAKLFFTDGSWLLIRASGTEPLVRVYVEGVADTQDTAYQHSEKILQAVISTLTGKFSVAPGAIKEKK